jgi:hypothetical protein
MEPLVTAEFTMMEALVLPIVEVAEITIIEVR